MSLLDWGNETVTLYPQVRTMDTDGNPILRVSTTGVEVQARVQPQSSEESDETGYNTDESYRLRIARGSDPGLGIGAEVDWRGMRWQVNGFPRRHSGSPRTRRLVYYIRRA